MHKFTIIVAALTLLAVSTAGHAAQKNQNDTYRYRWNDAHGQMHFSDSLTREAIENGYDVLNGNGMLVRHVQRRLSAQERKAADAAQAKADAARQVKERQHAQDSQMLAAYPTEDDFRDAQQAEVDKIVQSMRTTRVNLHSQEQNLADLLAHVADIKHSGKTVPTYMRDRIDAQREAVTQQRATLEHQQEAKAAAEKRMQKRIERYHTLKLHQRDQR